MLVSLLRAHTLGAYGFGGGYEPGMSSDTGFQLGQERTMRYALVPHDGRLARCAASSATAGNSIIRCSAAPSFRTKARCRRGGGCLDVSQPDVVVSSLKPSREATSRSASTRRPAERPGRDDQVTAQGAVGAARPT